jgi:energy-coupling factor transporter ATP-binding protein EcfA2
MIPSVASEGTMSEEHPRGGDREIVDFLFEACELRSAAERDASGAGQRERSLNERMHRSALDALEATHLEHIASLAVEHREIVERIETETEAAINRNAEHERALRSQASQRAEDQEERMQASLNRRIWMAESVFEGAKESFKRSHDEQIGAVVQRQAELDRLALDGHGVVRSYRQAVADEHAPVPTASAELDASIEAVAFAIAKLRKCRIAGLFRGPILVIPVGLVVGLSAVAGWFVGGGSGTRVLIAAATGLVGSIAGIAGLYLVAQREVQAHYDEFLEAVAKARGALASQRALVERVYRENQEHARRVRDADLAKADARFRPKLEAIAQQLQQVLDLIARKLPHYQAKILRQRAENIAAADAWHERSRLESFQRRDDALREENERHADVSAEADVREREMTAAAHEAWRHAQQRITLGFERLSDRDRIVTVPWSSPTWQEWAPPRTAAAAFRVGTADLSLSAVPEAFPSRPDLAWPPAVATTTWRVPVSLECPGCMSLVVEAPAKERERGLRIVKNAVSRLLTGIPAGKARFVFVDPVGLGQNFAGFMHLADDNPLLVSDRIWTDARHVEQRLADLTLHMETVIQKYLRNDFGSLEEYNRRAGEIAEPYRFLVMADFPTGVSEEAGRRLASILQSGARCGVHVILLRDPDAPLPPGVVETELRRATRTVRWTDGGAGPGGWTVAEGRMEGLRLVPDEPPGDEFLAELTRRISRAAKDASRVEVPFSMVAPEQRERWTQSAAQALRIPIGRSGATRLQYMSLGQGTSQHALIAGKTGSGKSSLLNAMIVSVALWYPPEEVEMWLVDFKKGVEFKAYADFGLPHLRAVAVESDREFGLSILQGLDDELRRRGELFRAAGVQNIADWRARGRPEPMPRSLLVMDEFQELFIDDDRVAQDAAMLLDRLVRQGRAFGMHAVLGSQTLGGAYGIARSTMGQMGIRIALQCTDADSQLILSDDNSAARLLTRPGEAIYNDAGGLLEGNNPFQVVWLPDTERADRLREAAAAPVPDRHPRPIVFEGNRRADPRGNAALEAALSSRPQPEPRDGVRVWLGDPISIKESTHARLARRSGANVAIVSQSPEQGVAAMAMAAISLAAESPTAGTRFVVLDGTTSGDGHPSLLDDALRAIPHAVERHAVREADAAILSAGEELARRAAPGAARGPALFVLVNGLHRLRSLRRDDNDFSMGDGPPTPDKVLGALLREGPSVGIHCLLWVDTAVNLQRSVDRATMRELNWKVLFQMSMADSSTLVDSPAAARLGMDRALLADDDAGTSEKFRPYPLPDADYLGHVAAALRARGG